MNVKYGKGTTEYGPGVEINLSGAEVAIAIDAVEFEDTLIHEVENNVRTRITMPKM